MDYKTPIYTEFAVIGVMAFVYAFIPESPYWCAMRGKHDQGVKVIRFLNGGIEGYDVEYHYNIIRRSVEKENAYQKQQFGEGKGFLQELANVKEVLTGVNGVSSLLLHLDRADSQFRTLIAFWPAFLQQLAGLAVVSRHSPIYCADIYISVEQLLILLCLYRWLRRSLHLLSSPFVSLPSSPRSQRSFSFQFAS